MACSPYDTQNDLRFDTFDQSDQSSLFAPTPGYHIPRTPPVIGSIDYNNVLGDESPALPDRQSEPSQIPLLQLSEWEEGKSYDESPPTYLHYWIVWKVTLNNKVVRKNTEQDLVLAPRFYWRLFLQPKLNELVGKKFPQRRVELDDTAIVVSVNRRTQQDLILCFDQTDVDWPTVEKQLLSWGDLFSAGKKLTLNISFNYTDGIQGVKSGSRATDKRGVTSVTQRMLLDRHLDINAEEEANGQPAAWAHVYSLMRCSGRPCELGPHCWRDPVSKKHYKLTAQNLRGLVNFVEQGGVLNSHYDVPETIREGLYTQEQQRLERQKGSKHCTTGTTYPPINITNVLPAPSSHSPVPATPNSTPAMFAGKNIAEVFDIPGLRDLAVAEYSEWQQSQVSDEKLKAEFRTARDLALGDGLDLLQVHEDQDPEFFIKNGVKRGIARRFVGDIIYWVKNNKCSMEAGDLFVEST
ncbi:uncharacterized protein N7529_007093 [Penicillium soppii]|uniref:uncharacterized protein n=1 Tax=Penicillium soppii TaxID=69789 RepID=UPI002547AB66|nr:uncharacterized protein N7529_007093 [Penicillium soppii]KAJ5865177.1 hypothetical protein N7529_007093 [Penicillium soppii]